MTHSSCFSCPLSKPLPQFLLIRCFSDFLFSSLSPSSSPSQSPMRASTTKSNCPRRDSVDSHLPMNYPFASSTTPVRLPKSSMRRGLLRRRDRVPSVTISSSTACSLSETLLVAMKCSESVSI
ncbi:hypothetical protein PMAYCL1PPCAC_18580 [Pristionchus mayeri]|uniref:Uncharacterized protein n=1 Tax=Pristionchus mayeri TaxID=1317129 RepID=A0AAN5CQ50_9BILA|nr:hypothetical protein PMAYCL1PPCAC_18580 [Pristionchus mayeri]